jgi:hypothetical protein
MNICSVHAIRLASCAIKFHNYFWPRAFFEQFTLRNLLLTLPGARECEQ